MDTPRSVLDAYIAGECVLATDLRAAIAWMLAAWDETVSAGAVLCATDRDDREAREAAIDCVLQAILDGDTDLRRSELDISCALVLPAFLAQRQEAQVERMTYPRPTST